MRSTLKRLARLTAGYSLVTLAGPLFTIILTPLYTRVLSPADYGVVDVSLTLSALITVFAMLGMDQALGAYFFDDDAAYQRDLATTAVISVGALGLVLGLGLAAGAVPIAQLLFKDIGRRYIIYLLAINIVSVPVYSVISAALRLQMGVKRVNILGLSLLAATIISNVGLVLVFRLKATGIVAANVIANTFACGVALVLARHTLSGTFSRQWFKPLARAGVSLLPGTLSFLLFANVDRLLLTQFVSQSELGLYSIANKLASMLYVMLSAAWTAWWPMALEMADQSDATRQYARMFEYFAAASMLLALSMGIFAPEILAVFTRDVYVPAAPLALVLMIHSGPVGFMVSIFTLVMYIRKQTHFVSVTYIAAAASNLVLNLILDPIIGVWGAVIATVLAGIVMAVSAYLIGQRLLFVSYRVGRIAVLAAGYLGLVAAFLFWPALDTAAFKVSAVIALALAIPAVGIISRNQIEVGIYALRYRLSRASK